MSSGFRWLTPTLVLVFVCGAVPARISHQLPTAVGDAPPPALLSRLGVLSPPTTAQSGRRLATGRAHRTRGDGGETQAPKARSNVLQVRAPRPSGRKHHWERHLTALATKPGEICGLAIDRSQLEPLPFPDLDPFEDVIRTRLEKLQGKVVGFQSSGTDTELADAYGTLGKYYLAFSLNEAAGVAFANAQALSPKDPRWTYYMAYVQEKAGNLEAAVRSYERALELTPDAVPTLIHLGNVLLEMGENEAAYDVFERTVELAPEEAAALSGLGRAAGTLDRPQEAVEHLQRALDLQPQATVLHYQLALAFRKIGKVDEARAELELRGETPVRFPDPLLNEIGPLQLSELIESVLEMAARPGEIDDRALADFAVGHLSDDLDAPSKLLAAIADLNEEAARQAKSGEKADLSRTVRARLHYVVAGLYHTRGDLGRASTELDLALSLAPDMAEAGLLQGRIHEQRGDLEGAAMVYSRILEANPDSTGALRNRARTRMALDDQRGAADDYARLCEQDPSRSWPRIQLAIAHARLGELELARRNYRKALELGLDPAEAAQVHYHLGILQSQAGSTETAAVEFRAAVELDPALVAAGLDLGAALGGLGLYQESAAAYRQVIAEDPANAPAWLGEATALNLSGDPRRALEVLEEGWRKNPGSVELLHALARLLASAEDPAVRDGERAVDLVRRTFRAGRTVERMETLAMAYAETGRFREAVETQKETISQAAWQGLTNLVPTLEANLRRYEAGRTCCAGFIAGIPQ